MAVDSTPERSFSLLFRSSLAALATTGCAPLLPRCGVVIIARNNTIVAGVGTRDDTVFPDPATLQWDANNLRQESRRGVIENMADKIVDLATRDAGVFFYSFAHSELGRAGDGPPSLWLATTQASRVELQGNSGTAGRQYLPVSQDSP